jgi:hypothetical protein
MRHLALCLLLATFSAPVLFAQDTVDTPPAAPDANAIAGWTDTLAELQDDIVAAAPDIAAGADYPVALIRRVKAMTYTTEAVTALDNVLAQLDPDLPTSHRDFVLRLMLAPLRYAPIEVVQDASSLIDTYLADTEYLELPAWTEEELGELAVVQQADESDDDFARRAADADEALATKLEEVQSVVFANAQTHALRLLRMRLLLKLDDDTADIKIIRLIDDAIDNQDLDLLDYLAAIRAQEDGMTQERAGWFYDQLKNLWPDKPGAKLTFTNFGDVRTSDLANPSFTTEELLPVTPLLRTINHLATIAKKPALRIN